MEIDKFSVDLPPHDRLAALEFRADLLHAYFTDGREKVIAADSIMSLSGARIRNDIPVPTDHPNLPNRMTWIVQADAVSSTPSDDAVSRGAEEFNFVVMVRVLGMAALWFLVAESFNFRKTLGADAGYSTEINLRELMRRLAACSPDAMRDKFFEAVLGGLPFPPPLNSLVEFFNTA